MKINRDGLVNIVYLLFNLGIICSDITYNKFRQQLNQMREDSIDNERNWTKKVNVQTTKVFTPNYSQSKSLLKMNKQYPIPQIQFVNQQNEHLNKNIAHISMQLPKLASLGEYLARENQQLRMHVSQRNQDVKHIIQTLQVNVSENTNDYQHQIHLLKESNCQIFKNIQIGTAKHADIEAKVQEISMRLKELNEQNTYAELDVLNPLKARLKGKLNRYNVDQLEVQQDNLLQSINKLVTDVNNLTVETNRLQKSNHRNTLQVRDGDFENKMDKDQARTDIVHVLKTMNELKEQIENLRLATERQENLNIELETKKIKSSDKLQQSRIELQKKNASVSSLLFEKEQIAEQIRNGRKLASELEIQRMKKIEQKQKVQKLVNSKRKAIKQAGEKQDSLRRVISQESEDKTKEIRIKIDKCQRDAQNQIRSITEDIKSAEEILQNLREQYRATSSDFDDYNSIIQKLENPVADIERAQMMLRLQGTRKALGHLSSNN